MGASNVPPTLCILFTGDDLPKFRDLLDSIFPNQSQDGFRQKIEKIKKNNCEEIQFNWVADYFNPNKKIKEEKFYESIYKAIQGNRKRKLKNNVVVTFQLNGSGEKILLKKLNGRDIEEPSVIIIKGFDSKEEDIKNYDYFDRRLISVLKLEKKQSFKLDELFQSIGVKLIGKLWEKECYYNERGNELMKYNPANHGGLEDASPDICINVLISGMSRAGKSTFINQVKGKLISKEADSLESVTQGRCSYLIPIPEFNGGALKLIDLPGIIHDPQLGDTIKFTISELKKIEKENSDNLEKIHFILFFLNAGQNIGEANQLFEYLKKRKIRIIFVINRSPSQPNDPSNDETRGRAVFGLKRYLSENNFSSLIETTKDENGKKLDNIVEVNLKTNGDPPSVPVFGMEMLFDVMYNFLRQDNDIAGLEGYIKEAEDLCEKISKAEKKEKEKEKEKEIEIEKVIKQIREFSKKLNKKFKLMENYKCAEDMVKNGKSKAIATISGCATLTASFGACPIPFADNPLTISTQALMIFGICQCYGQNISEINIDKFLGEVFGKKVDKKDKKADNSGSNNKKAIEKILFVQCSKLIIGDAAKFIPVVGTILGGVIDVGINLSWTIIWGTNAKAFFEKELIETGGIYFIKSRLKSYSMILNEIFDRKRKMNGQSWDAREVDIPFSTS